MATSTPPQASKRPAGSVTTPSHLGHSSPRNTAGKTPVNHPTTSSSGGKTVANTPMVHNLSQSGITSSPNTNMLNFHTPTGLGIDGTTPAGLNIPTPALGGAQMIPTMSDLGLAVSSGKRNEDEERRAKMRKVLRSIGHPKGRVSEDGIARISRRVGFQNDIDAEKLTPEEKERKVGNRPIYTAGKTILIDFGLKSNVPNNVSVTFDTKDEALKEHAKKAGKILLDDLTARNGVPLDITLDRFAVNLERLARTDRQSTNGVNCFEALSGVYTSLERLYEQELVSSKASQKDEVASKQSNAEVEVEVTCKKSGRPFMHEHGRVGFEITYWRQDRMLATEDDHLEEDVYTLCIEAEASSATLYPPLRVSASWLPDPLEAPSADSTEAIPWQDPPPTSLTSTVGETTMALDEEQKLPDLRFVAKLSPPLVMPYQTAMNVLSAVGAPAPQILGVPLQYAPLLLDLPASSTAHTAATGFITTAKTAVLSQKDGEESTVTHTYTLTSAKLDYGFQMEEIPFSHPRQLVELLPTLRQWASVGTLLKDVFTGPSQTPPAAQSTEQVNDKLRHQVTLDDLLTTPDNPALQGNVSVDITLAASPTPTISVTFPNSSGIQICSATVQILSNADMVVTHHEGVFPTDNTNDATEQANKLARALDACGDLGVWVEWMRRRS